MKLKVQPTESGISRVALSGRLDIFGVQEVDQQFTSQVTSPQKSVIVDLSEVDFLSSVGIRMFLTAARVLQASGARMVALNPQAPVEKTLRITGANQLIPIEYSLEAAVQRIQNPDSEI